MQSNNVNTYQPTPNDWTQSDLYADSWGYEDVLVVENPVEPAVGPYADSYSGETAPALDPQYIQECIQDSIHFAEQSGASVELLARMNRLFHEVNRAAALSPERREKIFRQILADLESCHSEAVEHATVQGADGAGNPDRKRELQGKLDRLKAAIENDPDIDNYLERDRWMESLARIQASLDLGNLDEAELSLMEIESALKSNGAEQDASDSARLESLRSRLEGSREYLNSLTSTQPAVQQCLERLAQDLTQTLTGLLDGSMPLDEVEEKIEGLEKQIRGLSQVVPLLK